MTGHVRISIAAWVATVLGALVLTPVFSGPFLFIAAFLCAAVTGVGVLLQNWRVPRFVVPVVQLLVLIELISFFFLRHTMKAGLLPWRDTAVAFNGQMVDAMDSINRYSAPLPPDRHLLLFAASVIAVAGLLIHLVAVQIRQAAWAGLLLLTMYTVPAATVHGGLPALLFVPPAIGYIVLLSAEGRTRLSRWGRRISGVSHLDAAEPIEASALGQAGRRIGLSVVALAALLPALIPALPEGVIGNGLSGSGGGGTGAIISANDPMLDMGKNLKRGDNVTALTYTGGPAGGVYLRLTALDLFDGNAWHVSSRGEGQRVGDDPLSPPPGYRGDLSKVQQTKMKIEVSRSFRSQLAPVPYPLRSISLKKNWKYDASALDIVSTNGQVVGGQDYSLTFYDLQPTAQELNDSIPAGEPDQFTSDLPQAKIDPRVRELAQQITASAKGNHFQQAAALQQWFRSGEFTYSTATDSKSGMTALSDFLLKTKSGYCEQFATGMALMARILGIPSRVGIGFLPRAGDKDNRHIVKMHDMHAWPELYFEGSGWVSFEPTPAARVSSAPNWTNPANVAPANPTIAPTTAPTTPGETVSPGAPNPNNPRNLPDESGTGVVTTGNWFTNGGAKLIGLTLAAILLLCVPWLIRTLTRRKRFSRPPSRIGIEGLWAEVRDTSRDLGLEWSEIATPRQLGDWLVSKVPAETQPQALRLARGVEAMRYAGLDGDFPDLRVEAEAVRKALWTDIRFVRRWRARMFPPSWRWYLNRGSSEASDLLDEFDLLLARLRTALTPRRAGRHAN